MSQQANDIIMGGGAPAAKFTHIGAIVKGTITDLSSSQMTDIKTKERKFWNDGNPMMQAIITLQTDECDPQISNDDGKRRLFVSSKAMREAIKAAVERTGQRELVVGGELGVQYTGDGVPEPNLSPPKLYAADYRPPAMQTSLLGAGAAQTPPEQPQSPPVTPPASPAPSVPAGTSLLG